MPHIVMLQRGAANGSRMRGDGEFLAAFDFEAHNGRGEITHTADIQQAKQFASMEEVLAFWGRVPKCKPLREDGRPNKPLTSATWEFKTID